jgi:hypothetical protein
MSWIGYADFRALAAILPADQQSEVLKGLNPPTPLAGQAGPLKTLLDLEPFDEVHLLSSHGSLRNRLYLRWVGGNAVLHPVKVNNPTDYAEIFRIVDAEMAAVVRLPRTEGEVLCVHLSPGTPAMTAIWLLLGKSKYQPTIFYQTHSASLPPPTATCSNASRAISSGRTSTIGWQSFRSSCRRCASAGKTFH